MTFIKHHKHHFGAFIILIIIAIVSGYFAFGTTNKTQNTVNTTQTTTDDTVIDTTSKTQDTDDTTQNTRLPEPEAQSAAADGQAINKTQITKGEKLDSTTSTISDVKNDSQQFNNLSIKQLNNPVTVRIDNKNYQTAFASSTTVYDLMAKLKSENKFSFSGKEYSGMGFFVDEINGVKNDNLSGKYWIYYINGQSAQVGISNYIIKPNDLIEWKYENAKF